MDQSACYEVLGFATISETRSGINTRRFPALGHVIFHVSLNPTYALERIAIVLAIHSLDPTLQEVIPWSAMPVDFPRNPRSGR